MAMSSHYDFNWQFREETMTAVSTSMMEAIRESLKNSNLDEDRPIPLKGMNNHYCSLQKIERETGYLLLFIVDVDGNQVFIYFKVSVK
jgi:hypothetical protein